MNRNSHFRSYNRPDKASPDSGTNTNKDRPVKESGWQLEQRSDKRKLPYNEHLRCQDNCPNLGSPGTLPSLEQYHRSQGYIHSSLRGNSNLR